MNKKTLTIYIKSSLDNTTHFYKFNINCYCGRCVMPECKKCKSCSNCNVISGLQRKGIDVIHKINSPENREAVIVAQSVHAIKKAYDAAFSAIRSCSCEKKKKSK